MKGAIQQQIYVQMHKAAYNSVSGIDPYNGPEYRNAATGTHGSYGTAKATNQSCYGTSIQRHGSAIDSLACRTLLPAAACDYSAGLPPLNHLHAYSTTSTSSQTARKWRCAVGKKRSRGSPGYEYASYTFSPEEAKISPIITASRRQGNRRQGVSGRG